MTSIESRPKISIPNLAVNGNLSKYNEIRHEGKKFLKEADNFRSIVIASMKVGRKDLCISFY
jgi:hypothetical protein